MWQVTGKWKSPERSELFYVFSSDKISAVFVRFVFPIELSWNQLLMRLEAITLRYWTVSLKRKCSRHFKVERMFRQLETGSIQKSWAVFRAYLNINSTIKSTKVLMSYIIIIILTPTYMKVKLLRSNWFFFFFLVCVWLWNKFTWF